MYVSAYFPRYYYSAQEPPTIPVSISILNPRYSNNKLRKTMRQLGPTINLVSPLFESLYSKQQ